MVDSGGIQATLSEAYGVCGSGGSVSRSYMIVGDTVRMRKSGKGRNTRGGFYDRMSGTLRVSQIASGGLVFIINFLGSVSSSRIS